MKSNLKIMMQVQKVLPHLKSGLVMGTIVEYRAHFMVRRNKRKSISLIKYYEKVQLGETSKFTTECHKLLQGDVGEVFLQFLWHVTESHYYHL